MVVIITWCNTKPTIMNNNKHLGYPNSRLSERFGLVPPCSDNRGWTVLMKLNLHTFSTIDNVISLLQSFSDENWRTNLYHFGMKISYGCMVPLLSLPAVAVHHWTNKHVGYRYLNLRTFSMIDNGTFFFHSCQPSRFCRDSAGFWTFSRIPPGCYNSPLKSRDVVV